MKTDFRDLVKCTVNDINEQEITSLFLDSLKNRNKLLLGFANVAKSIDCGRNEELKVALSRSDYIVADGIGICIAATLLCKQKLSRITGVDLFEKFIRLGVTGNYKIYFLGGTLEVNNCLKEKVANIYGAKHLICGRDGYFSNDEWNLVVDEINECRPDILFVGMSSPMKETFLAAHKDDLHVSFMMGVGGAFDVYTKKVKRAPAWTRRLGLEWLVRALREPRRMRRNFGTVTLFIIQLSLFYMRGLFSFERKKR